jgi:hypothetical protein
MKKKQVLETLHAISTLINKHTTSIDSRSNHMERIQNLSKLAQDIAQYGDRMTKVKTFLRTFEQLFDQHPAHTLEGFPFGQDAYCPVYKFPKGEERTTLHYGAFTNTKTK